MPSRLRSMRPMMRCARALLVLLALAVGLTAQGWADTGLHCRQHQAHGASHKHSHTAVVAPSSSCDHCPGEQCGTTVPCSGTSSASLVAPGLTTAWASLAATLDFTVPLIAGTTAHQPPTPPPQAIA
jgi:hypothetical protein